MTILFASGEDTGFTLNGAAVGSTVPGCSRSGFARSTGCGVSGFNSTTVADPPANRFTTPTFTAGNNIWLHGQLFFGSTGSSTLNEQGLILRSPDGVPRLILRQTGTFGTIKISSRNSIGSIADLVTSSAGIFAVSTLYQFDLHVDYSSSGGVALYINSLAAATFTGDPRTDAATQLNQADFASFNSGGSAATANTWSEIIIADEDARGMALWTLNPQAAGNTQSWTPNTLANINKATISDTTSISTTTANALSQWTTPTSAPSGSWSVKAIVQEARVEVGTTGPQHFDWSLRTASTDFVAGASIAPSTTFGNFSNQLWATNPNTSAAWAIGDIASGFNLGIKALA